MRFGWLAALVLPAITLLALSQMSGRPHEQTAFLERIATRLEQAKTIPPETERQVWETIRSIRRSGPPSDERLDERQKIAIQRIENKLWSATGAFDRMPPNLAGGLARPHAPATEEAEAAALGKPLRPLYPFQASDADAYGRTETR